MELGRTSWISFPKWGPLDSLLRLKNWCHGPWEHWTDSKKLMSGFQYLLDIEKMFVLLSYQLNNFPVRGMGIKQMRGC